MKIFVETNYLLISIFPVLSLVTDPIILFPHMLVWWGVEYIPYATATRQGESRS